MAKQVGREVYLKVDNGSGTKTVVAGLNSKTISVNNESIDATTPPATAGEILWAQSLAGMKSFAVSGDGIFLDESDQEGRLNDIVMDDDPVEGFDIVVPDFGTYSGEFRVVTFELGGETAGAVTFSISLESTGAVTFTAA